MKGVLHVVATPIGNLEDMGLRGIRVLGEADLVLAEDTRHTRVLLEHHHIPARPVSLHAHNEAARISRALEVLAGGGSVALVSDAGTPLVSDPGERLVAAAAAAGHRVSPIPGPSAVLAAVAVSGLASEPFAFLGFLPRKAGARAERIAAYAGRPETLVLFESPRRVAATLHDLARGLGDRRACIARELTKLHEELLRGTLGELALRVAGGVRGEVTIVVAGADAPRAVSDVSDVDGEIRQALAAGRPVKELAAEIAKRSGLPRRAIYERALALRDGGS